MNFSVSRSYGKLFHDTNKTTKSSTNNKTYHCSYAGSNRCSIYDNTNARSHTDAVSSTKPSTHIETYRCSYCSNRRSFRCAYASAVSGPHSHTDSSTI